MRIINKLIDKIVDLRFKNIRPQKSPSVLRKEIMKLELLSYLIYKMEVKQHAKVDR